MDSITLKGRITNQMTDEEFFWFCQENKDLRIERNSHLEIILMSPVTSIGANYSGEVFRQLANWAIANKNGLAFDSSAGFTLPDNSVLSPDACWVSFNQWNKLSPEDINRFAPICPEFVIEVRSKSDNQENLKKKMKTWLSNGAKLAWLIDPIEKKVFIFQSGSELKKIKGFDQKITAIEPAEGFILDLSLLNI